MFRSIARSLAAATLILTLGATASVHAQAMPDATDWQPGPAAMAADYFCEGFIDSPTSGSSLSIDKPFTVTGWVVDTNAQGWAGFDAVHVYAGIAGQGGKLLSIGSLPKARPDVAAGLSNPYWAASGFEAVVPAGRLDPGPVALTVYAHSPARGWWYKQVDVTLTRPSLAQPILDVQSPEPTARLKTSQDYTIAGFALDPGAREGTGVDRVEVYINGERGAERSQLVGIADTGDRSDTAADRFGAQFANAGWSLRIEPTRYRSGNTLLYVYARSAVTGGETLTTVDINIVEK